MKHKHLFSCLLLITSTVLSGCSTGFPGARPRTYVTPGETRLFISATDCPHAKNSLEFISSGMVITAIGAQLLTNFGTALSQGAQGGTLSPEGATLNMTLDPGVLPGCIVIIRGDFEKKNPESLSSEVRDLFAVPDNDLAMQTKVDNLEIPAIYRADYVLETQLMVSNNKKAMKLSPVFLKFNRSVDGSRSGTRDITVKYDFTTPGGNKSGSVLAIRNVSIDGRGKIFEKNVHNNYPNESPWFTPFNVSEGKGNTGSSKPTISKGGAVMQTTVGNAAPITPQVNTAGGPGSAAKGSALPTGNADKGLPSYSLYSGKAEAMPVTLASTVVETRPTNEGLAFIAAVFNTVRPELENTLKDNFDPETMKRNDSNAADAESNYLTALGAARKAEIEYCSLSQKGDSATARADRITKSSAAGAAQAKANSAAIRVGKTYDFPRVIPVSESTENIQIYCD
ncbi:MAG: hypothetical protein ACRCT4_00995 [Silvania sp.]